MTQNTLYRYWKNEELLYIGVSVNAYARAKQHAADSEWWGESDRVTFERYPDRSSVLDAEKSAIISERPLYNKIHNRRKSQANPAQQKVSTGLVGMYGHILKDNGRGQLRWNMQYRVVASLSADHFLIQFFSAMTGSPTNQAVRALVDISQDRLFRDAESWRAQADRESGQVSWHGGGCPTGSSCEECWSETA